MPIEITRATNAEIDDVVHVIKAVYDEYAFTWDPSGYHLDLYNLEEHYDGSTAILYIARDDGKAVGTVGLGLFEPVGGDKGPVVEICGMLRVTAADCSLERLYVHPSGRCKGVGNALFERVLNEARTRGKHWMEIWSDKRFADAHRLYGRFGAEVVGDRICHDPDHSPEWGLRIRL